MSTTFQLVHAAGNMFDRPLDRHAIVTEACRHADVVTLSEVVKDHAWLQHVPDFDVFTVGELAILWRRDRFELDATPGHHQVMAGGHRGDGIHPHDHRRRGPARLEIHVPLRERRTTGRVKIHTHHGIAKPDTSQKWRRRLSGQGFRGTADAVIREHQRDPEVPQILTGDLNRIGKITAFLRAGLHQVPTPATFGRRRYDRIFVSRGVLVHRVRRIRTAGDHRALWAVVTLAAPAHVNPPPARASVTL